MPASPELQDVCGICWETTCITKCKAAIVTCGECRKQMHLSCAMQLRDVRCPMCRAKMFDKPPNPSPNDADEDEEWELHSLEQVQSNHSAGDQTVAASRRILRTMQSNEETDFIRRTQQAAAVQNSLPDLFEHERQLEEARTRRDEITREREQLNAAYEQAERDTAHHARTLRRIYVPDLASMREMASPLADQDTTS